jgi:hypothetical protein
MTVLASATIKTQGPAHKPRGLPKAISNGNQTNDGTISYYSCYDGNGNITEVLTQNAAGAVTVAQNRCYEADSNNSSYCEMPWNPRNFFNTTASSRIMLSGLKVADVFQRKNILFDV